MRSWVRAGLLALLTGSLASAAEYPLDNALEQQQCQGMYSRSSWGGSVDPAITVVLKPADQDAIVSLIIFEYTDEPYLGRPLNKDSWEKTYICTEDATKMDMCNSTDIGKFITEPSTNKSSTGSIYTSAVNLKGVEPIKYPIKKTGYYCVWTNAFSSPDLKYTGVVTFQNSYGELPASQIAKLPFYGGLAIVYALIGALWAFLYVQHRSDILAVQNYITAIIIFLIVEMIITWTFYNYQNIHGNNTFAKVLMIVVAVLNAARNSFSFFLLLIVCMGYGVVKPSLGSMMKWVRILGLLHFVFGVIYAVASLTITPDSAGPIVMLVILPLAATLTAFYVWTLNSLKLTLKELEERKQKVKGLMYRRLWWLLLGSILVIFGFFFLNSLTFAGHGSPDFVPSHWKTRWFVLDGWLNLVYLVDIAVVSYLWRPTANNRRFAMSDEIAQDDDGGFEIASLGGSELDDDEDRDEEEGGAGRHHQPLRSTSPPSRSASAAAAGGAGGGITFGGVSGGTVQRHEPSRHIESEDEAIFEIGEGDGWSEGEEMSDDNGDDAKKRLTGKKD